MLFNIDKATRAWKKLEPSKIYQNGKSYSAWERLVHYLKHHGIHQLDGGLLRVVALFGDNFIEYDEINRFDECIDFWAGPCQYTIRTTINSHDPKERYLLSKTGRICWDDEHLHRYLKEYMCHWHAGEECDITPCFDLLYDFLDKEIQMATRKKDYQELGRLNQIVCIMQVLADM